MIHSKAHVFSNSTGDISQSWDELKQAEKSEKSISILADIPKSLPALARAFKIQKKVAKVGFDWDDINEVWLKLDEEIAEIKEAIISAISSSDRKSTRLNFSHVAISYAVCCLKKKKNI